MIDILNDDCIENSKTRRLEMLKKLVNFIYYILRSQLYTQKEKIIKDGGKVGRNVFFGDDVIIDYDFAFLLEIEDGAVISSRTIIEMHDSSVPNARGYGENKIGKVRICKRAYIGVNSVVLPGVTVGPGSITGACSLINRDIPAGEVWGGVPASYICMVDDLIKRRKETSRPEIAYFDWIGEIEKCEVDYKIYREEFKKKVKAYFLQK